MEQYVRRWFAATGCSGLQKNAAGNFTWSSEPLLIGKTVIAAESADGLAFGFEKAERGVRAGLIAINAVLSKRRIKGLRRWPGAGPERQSAPLPGESPARNRGAETVSCGLSLLGLPATGKGQCGEDAEFEARERIQ